MLTDHAKLMRFFSDAEEVSGRKKLQKMIYILQKWNFPFEEKYQFHFYGPYSEELSLRVEELCNLGFLAEEKENKSNYVQYHYHITGSGRDFLQQFGMTMPDMTEPIALLQEKSSRFLELVATMLYFDGLSRDDVNEKVHTVKPKQQYTDLELDEAHRLIQAMHPVQ
ncbi:YwgA family protein [Lentibacillus halophilus]|uniref:YwgA family protein n=1 Tax=Lentibacillus halophilus TaxID=295065 RepID=A0ABN0Z7H6_9BACI